MEKLLAIVSLGQNIYGKWLSRRLLYGAIVAVSLTIVTSVMAGVMLVSSFYAAYLTLLQVGVETQTAIGIISGLAALLTLLLIFVAFRCLRRLRDMPRRLLQEKIPQAAHAGDVIDAFLDGFLRS